MVLLCDKDIIDLFFDGGGERISFLQRALERPASLTAHLGYRWRERDDGLVAPLRRDLGVRPPDV